MQIKLGQIFYLSLLVTLAGCATQTVQEGADPVSLDAVDMQQDQLDETGQVAIKRGVVLIFHEKEPDNEAHRVVYFVNKDVMRINDWQQVDDYILFDRKTQTIYNVTKESKTIFVIKPNAVEVDSPIEYELVEAKEKSAAAVRTSSGESAYFYKYSINDRVCYNVVSLEGYLDDVRKALAEFRVVLAGEHAKTISNTPKEMLDPCDLAMNIFQPTRYIDHGFPIREWDSRGYQRFLVDVRAGVQTEARLLEIPEDYKQYSISPN